MEKKEIRSVDITNVRNNSAIGICGQYCISKRYSGFIPYNSMQIKQPIMAAIMEAESFVMSQEAAVPIPTLPPALKLYIDQKLYINILQSEAAVKKHGAVL
jgi:hypothetical protein